MKQSVLPFVGRVYELDKLETLYANATAGLVVVRGRRRIGKSRLVEEFAKNKRLIRFSGLAPGRMMTARHQRENFVDQFCAQLGGPRLAAENWTDLFNALAAQLGQEPTVLLFDEISWMAHGDPAFLPKLKEFWDSHASKYPGLLMVLCSSISSWIDENILASKAFYGRVHGQITLEPLSLSEAKSLLNARGIHGSPQEILSILSVTGCVPWYLELLSPAQSVLGNIKRLCFERDAPLVKEYERIFSDLFERRADIYSRLVSQLLAGPRSQAELSRLLSYSNSARFGHYLQDLSVAGFITRDAGWSLSTGKPLKQLRWRLSDNYLRFYLKYIEPQLHQIQLGNYEGDFSILENFSTVMGLQFENLVLNNRGLILNKLGLERSQLVCDGPYLQTKTAIRAGCQIDYLIQTKLNALFLCEIKFSRRPLSTDVIKEVEEKRQRLVIPRHMSIFPVLIHVNGVSDELLDSGYFYKIIDVNEFLV